MVNVFSLVCADGARWLPIVSWSSSISSDVMLPGPQLAAAYLLLAALASLSLLRCIRYRHWLPLPARHMHAHLDPARSVRCSCVSAAAASSWSSGCKYSVCYHGACVDERKAVIAAATWRMQAGLWLHTGMYLV
jgi:hypothetical protein